ncbi:hypothetical protein [Halorussus marinus]|uniref:hypothetical protein n=1 Tax=Halorussus marinus TaxID=2505976 RepID=UPI00106DEE32|nr:hypothetical protein [Halorussus marinus]
MRTYGPEVTFDFPSGDDRVQVLVEAVGLDYGESHHFWNSHDVDDELRQALQEAITVATHGRVDLFGFELHTIDHTAARVEITGSFGVSDDLPSDFESFAKEGGHA